MFFSVIVTLGAAAVIHSQQSWTEKFVRLWFAIWLVLSLAVIIALWIRHQTLIKNIGDYEPFEKKRQMGP
jgi:hypothetical protein